MKSWVLSMSLTAMSIFAFAEGNEPKYPVSQIPEELKKDVNAVVRESKTIYRILSPSKAKRYVYFAVTIFNAKARDYAEYVVLYDKLSKITDFNATAYDADGKQIKKLKNNEIYDQSAYDGVSMFSDNRLKAVDMRQVSYPYTVVFEYEKDYNFIFGIEGASVLREERVSVQSFSYQLVYPAQLAPRYKTLNMTATPVKGKNDEGLETLTWTVENVMPVVEEPYSPDNAFYPKIMAAPSSFEFDGYAGTMGSWDEFAKWIKQLNTGRNVLPEQTKEKILKLTAGAKTKQEKIKILYEYLQGKTRYVAIMLGIGGFQPFEASVVDQTGYGDCKALSNYMVSMLDVVGIKGYYALIYGGDDYDGLDTTFPNPSEFNHAVVAVPVEKDTIWLECTNQTIPLGFQGSFTGDRKALLITDNGGKIVNTTRYSAQDNSQTRTAEVQLEMSGDGKARVQTRYRGVQYENGGLHFVVNYQHEEQKKWVLSTTKIPAYDVNTFSMLNQKDRNPTATVNLDLTLKKYATVSGKRIFLTPNLMNRNSFVPEKLESRKTNVVSKVAFIDLDTVHYKLPEGIYPEYLPTTVKLTSRFGDYEASYKMEDDGSLTYIRKFQVNKGEFPPESYAELVDFYKGVSKADNTKVVFLNKT